MRILVACIGVPFPFEHGEYLRIANYVRLLATRHTFDLVCTGSGEVPAALKALFRRVSVVDADGAVAKVSRFASLRPSLFVPSIPRLTAEMAKLQTEAEYDLLWASGEVVPSVPLGWKCPILADVVDDLGLQYRRELDQAAGSLDYLRRLKRLVLAREYQKRTYRRASACLFVTDADARSFSRTAPAVPVRALANGVDCDFFSPATPGAGDGSKRRLVFEGSFAFPPNADAAQYFCREILPLVRRELPDVTIDLVGRDPPNGVLQLASEGVTVTGTVPDIRPYVRAAALFVCPLRMGAGMKNKVLQAWAMEKAVIATPISTAGLDCVDGENIVIREQPAAFAEAVIQLLNDDVRRHVLGTNGRQTVLHGYTWTLQAHRLEQTMHSIVGRHALV